MVCLLYLLWSWFIYVCMFYIINRKCDHRKKKLWHIIATCITQYIIKHCGEKYEKYISTVYSVQRKKQTALYVNLVQISHWYSGPPTVALNAYQCLLSCHSRHISSLLVLFLASDVTAESHVGRCITYLHVQSDVSRINSQCTFVYH